MHLPNLKKYPFWWERFWEKIDKSGECWLWTRGTTKGYGHVAVGYGQELAHRLSYFYFFGPIPSGKEIHHNCHTLCCVNPAHLEALTPLENKMRERHRFNKCRYGHTYTPENTYIAPNGYRQCRTCNRAADARRKAKNMAFNG